MSDPIYSGWGNRTRVKGAIKQSIANADIRRNASKLSPSLEALKAELRRLTLDTDVGLQNLASIMAADILTSH